MNDLVDSGSSGASWGGGRNGGQAEKEREKALVSTQLFSMTIY